MKLLGENVYAENYLQIFEGSSRVKIVVLEIYIFNLFLQWTNFN